MEESKFFKKRKYTTDSPNSIKALENIAKHQPSNMPSSSLSLTQSRPKHQRKPVYQLVKNHSEISYIKNKK
jgi:hypothetical protein